jgi:hypothetical protein
VFFFALHLQICGKILAKASLIWEKDSLTEAALQWKNNPYARNDEQAKDVLKTWHYKRRDENEKYQ